MSSHRTLAAFAALSFLTAPLALADGTEQLGAPVGLSPGLAEGSGVILAGLGVHGTGAGYLEVEVPEGLAVKQVLLYWEGFDTPAAAFGVEDTIFVDGVAVTGQRIGGPSRFFLDHWTAAYRADVTDLDLVQPGVLNVLEVDGLDFALDNDGVGALVVVDDGSDDTTEIQLRDGLDTAYRFFGEPYKNTIAQTFDFAAHDADRVADLGMFFASIGGARPSVVTVAVDGVEVDRLVDLLDDGDGPLWDTLEHELVVPAGATSVTVQAWSLDDGSGPFAGNQEASLIWLAAAFSLTTPAPEQNDEGGCESKWWKKKCKGKGWGCKSYQWNGWSAWKSCWGKKWSSHDDCDDDDSWGSKGWGSKGKKKGKSKGKKGGWGCW